MRAQPDQWLDQRTSVHRTAHRRDPAILRPAGLFRGSLRGKRTGFPGRLARFEKLQVEGVAGGDMKPVITVIDLAFITGLILDPPILDGLKREERQKLLRLSLVNVRKIRASSKQRSGSETYMAE